MSMKEKVSVQIYPYEINQKDVVVGDTRSLHIESHWLDSNRIMITMEGKTYTVLGEDLKRAIENAMNVRLV